MVVKLGSKEGGSNRGVSKGMTIEEWTLGVNYSFRMDTYMKIV